METSRNKRYIELLLANKNLIFTGAPGTGKTFLAKEIAKEMGAEYEFVQFHPSYDYTDFVEGLRPTPPDKNGNIGFRRMDGVFKTFCKKALLVSDASSQKNGSAYNINGNIAKSFDKAYGLLVEAIKKNTIVLYSDFRNNQTVMKVSIKYEQKYNREIIQFNKSGKFQNANIEYLKQIYSYYISNKRYDIRRETFGQFVDIIGNTLDYSYYRGIVQGLLDFTDKDSEQESTEADTSLFEQCYKELLDDIKNGKTEIIRLKTGISTVLSVTSMNSIRWHRRSEEDKDSDNVVTLNRLMKLYSKYSRLEDVENMDNIDKAIKEVIGGANTTYYWAVLHEILSRMKAKSQEPLVQRVDPKPYVFIIDEINRGEISKIFGELFFSIDPGYRGEKGRVKTQYQNLIIDIKDPFYKGFFVPENVYIIGTMNDIDRSVESIDFAMRRRFAWVEIKADENTGMLDILSEMKKEVVSVMNRLNTAIWDEDNDSGIDGLAAAYHIGGSYFSKLSLYLNKEHTNKSEAYRHLWENHLKILLSEYLRGTVSAAESIKKLEKVYYNGIGADGFE